PPRSKASRPAASSATAAASTGDAPGGCRSLARSPRREERPRLIAGGRLHAVAAVAGRGHRGPVAARTRFGRAVDRQRPRADEVAAVPTVHGRRRLVADGAGPQIPRLEAAGAGDGE